MNIVELRQHIAKLEVELLEREMRAVFAQDLASTRGLANWQRDQERYRVIAIDNLTRTGLMGNGFAWRG